MPGTTDHYRSRSLWLDTLVDDPLTPRSSLGGDLGVDVAIVGAGFTGLWTAYYLKRADPGLRIAIVESEIAGFGASGRNGGWCSALLPMSWDAIAHTHGRQAAIDLQLAMNDTVSEVGRVALAEGIDCDFAHGGYLHAARNPAHLARLHDDVEHFRSWGFDHNHLRFLDGDEAATRVAMAGIVGANHTPHCAAIHPAKLVRALARVVESLGVSIFEHTRALEIDPGRIVTEGGTVRATNVVRATEGYTARLPGQRRTVVPIYSLMVATEPLADSVWEQIGLTGRETFNDARRLIIYGQRTADNRLAFGGRGAPYHFGSRIETRYDRDPKVHESLRVTLRQLFPAIGDARFTHAWGGPLGAPRDWRCSVGLDRVTGMAWAGGYVGDGVGTTNLAGRTIADLIRGEPTDITRLAWVGHHSPAWEPEPVRWLAINAILRLPKGADAHEERTGRPEKARSWLLAKALGK